MDQFPTDIQSYLREIAERLWTGHASVMVGAGFSKNAVNTVDSSKSLPNWQQLGDTFYEKLHGKKPDSKAKYLSLLKLAEEFEAAFGRSKLENFVAKNISDTEYEPSDSHKMLMELPWTDVFTTNYDTLLERSCKDILSRRYDVVVNQNDLIYSNKPRIIKLHGSLPSERPFIITEEDYRIYPKKYAPFVNTVQQSLLENTLCLIGFSGDDPNFLQWLGWINDNFGKSNSPKIYLVGLLNLTESQKKLLHNKNIISVDLSTCKEVNNNHRKGLEIFLNYLSSQQIKRENLEWPYDSDLQTMRQLKDNIDFKSLISEWRNCREKYPNWIFLPREQRDKLWIFTEMHSSNESAFEHLQLFEDLDYIYELNWRLEKCLFPIWNNMIPHFQKILDNYNFFPEQITENRKVDINTYDNGNLEWDRYKKQWITLALSILRFYREEGYEKEWSSTFKIINLIKQHLTNDQIAHFYYEQILNAIFKMHHTEAKKLLDEWPQDNMSVFWNAKRAMLMTEFSQLKEAANLLEFCLLEIRRKLNLSPIENDYTWVSQEAYIMFQLKMVQRNIQWAKMMVDNNEKEKAQNFNERWNDLLQYKCDPWGEKNYFDLMLQQAYTPQKMVSIKNSFEIGRSTRSFTMGGSSKDFIIAYTFLRYLEELAIPLSLSYVNIDNETISGVLKRIGLVSPKWGIAILNRYRDSKPVEAVLDRTQLINLPLSTIDRYIKEYIELFKFLLPERKSNTLSKAVTDKVPFILSRLCVKCSEELRVELFSFYQDLFKQNLALPQLEKLLINLINASNQNTLQKAAELLLDTPILSSNSKKYNDIPEPFDFLKPHHIEGKLEIKQELVNDLIKKAGENREIRPNAIKRGMFLYTSKQLNKSQIKKFFDIVWQQKDVNGFPIDTTFYYFPFLQWPRPNLINVEKIFRKYIEVNNFNVQKFKKDKGIGMSGGKDRYAIELISGSQSIHQPQGVVWKSEALAQLLIKCEQWWNADKHYLQDESYKSERFGGSIYEEFLARFTHLAEVLAYVFGYRLKGLTATFKKRLIALILDMENLSVPILKAKIVFGLYDNYKDYLIQLQVALVSKDDRIIVDAFQSTILAIHSSPYKAKPDFQKKLLTVIISPLQWRITDLMGHAFNVLEDLIKNSNLELNFIIDSIYSSLQWVLDLEVGSEVIQLELGDYLLLKRYSASLAGTLYNRCIERGLSVPQPILNWKQLCEDENEFGDIKNRWKTFDS